MPKTSLEHGGSLRRGKRKIIRPLDPKRPLHVVLRSLRAKGEWSLNHRKNRAVVSAVVYEEAHKSGVIVQHFANVGNHLHIVICGPTRKAIQRFLRVVPGQIAMKVMKAAKGAARGRFWEKLAYSRVVSWGRELKAVLKYVSLNLIEGQGYPREELDRIFGRDRIRTKKKISRGPPIVV